ncbi:hypothetical protein BGZ83_009721 [Gryganskiella cystojenkinii]|nr:hypothetical protein BGZ83_009721 [Gryganskiella cystojenkinii]
MGNSPSSPSGPADGHSSPDKNDKNAPSTSVNKQQQQQAQQAADSAGRGKVSNIPIHPRPQQSTTPYVPVTQHRPVSLAPPPLPPTAAQPRPTSHIQPHQQQQHLQPSRPPVPLPQRQQQQQLVQQPNPNSSRMTAPSTTRTQTEDEIPTVVLKEQMESMSIEIATAEHRVRELREELDTFESHTEFSTMMLAWFYSFNPGEYTVARLEDLKRDALKAWQPVLSSFKESTGGTGGTLTEIDVQLFESIIQDVISHANLIVGSTLPPEDLIENIKQVARTELQSARKRLDDNRNAFQECQIILQQRGVVPASVLEMQRQIEEEQRQAQEARRAKEQRQREIEEQRQLEIQLKKRQQEEKEMREREEEDLKRQQQLLLKQQQLDHENRERQERQEKLRKQQEEMRQKIDAASRPARPSASAGHVVGGRQKSSSVAVPNSLPAYTSQFVTHAEAPAALGMTFTEEETVLTDYSHQGRPVSTYANQHSNSSSISGAYLTSAHSRLDPEREEEEVPSTPLIRRQRPLANVPEPSMSAVTPPEHGIGMAPSVPSYGFRIPVPGDGPYPPNNQSYPPSHGINTSAASVQPPTRMPTPYGFNINQELPHTMPEVPHPHPGGGVGLYPPQIIPDQDLDGRLAREKLEQLKKQNEEMERGLYESHRLHDLAVKNMELQGVYPPYTHPGGPVNDHLNHNQQYPGASSPYSQYAGYPPPQHLQQQQQHQQPGYPGYQGDVAQNAYNTSPYNNSNNSNNAQDQTYAQGDGYNNYAPYGQYNNNHTAPWQHQSYPTVQQPVYPPVAIQNQHQQGQYHHHQQQQQEQLHQHQHQGSSPGQQFQQPQQQQHPGQQHDGYVDPRVHSAQAQSTVVYSMSPYGAQYDLGQVPQPISPTSQTPSSSQVENDASSAQVLPQIRANPPKPPPFRRAPQAILVQEDQQSQQQQLQEEEENVSESMKAMKLSSTPENSHGRKSGRTTPSPGCATPTSDDTVQHKSSKNGFPRPPAASNESQPETRSRREEQQQHHQAVQEDEWDEEDEEEEEELLRRPRATHAALKPAPRPAPRPVSTIEQSSSPTSNNNAEASHDPVVAPVIQLRPVSRVNNNQVFNPFPNQRAGPRPSPRPAPRPIGGMVKPSQESLSGSTPVEQDQQSDSNSLKAHSRPGSTDGNTTPPHQTSLSTGPTVETKRLSILSRSPSIPPVVPKKPVALRSPRSEQPSE